MRRLTITWWLGFLLLVGLAGYPAPVADAHTEGTPGELVLTPEERAWLDEHPRIRLGDDFAWPPFVFRDDQGLFSGISAGYVAALSSRLGIEIQPVMGLTWAQVLEGIKNGGIDMLPAVVKSPEREAFLHFTRPFITFPVVIATHEDGEIVAGLGDLEDRRVGVVKGYITHERLAREHPRIHLVTFDSLGAALEALENRRLDALVDNLGAITYQVRHQRLAHVRIAAPTPYKFELAMAVRKEWPELAILLDRALATLSSRERAAIENTWLAVEVRFGLEPRTVLLWAVPLGLSALIVILFVDAVWNRKLQREVAQRQETQRQLEGTTTLLAASHRELQHKSVFIDNILRYSTDLAIAATDLDYRIQYFNPRAEQLFGYRQEEVVGRSVQQMHELAGVDPARFQRARAEVAEKGRHDYQVTHEVDGTLRTISATMTGIVDADGSLQGYVLLARDVTEARQAERYRMRNEERLGLLLELNREASNLSESELCSKVLEIAVRLTDSEVGYLHAVDEDREQVRLVTWNMAALASCRAVHATHYPISQAGLWADSLRRRAPVVHNDFPTQPGRKGYPEGHLPLRRHLGVPVLEGERIPMLIGVGNKAAPYDANDIQQLQLVATEIPKFLLRWRTEAALREARARAEAASRAKGDFLAAMSHEIRTPMNVVIGMGDVLLESGLNEEQLGYVGKLQQAGVNLLELINQILDLSKIEAGELRIVEEPVGVGALLQEVADLMSVVAEGKGLRLACETDGMVPQWLLGDRLRLRQVLFNLVGNAIKFTERGKITLRQRVDPPATLHLLVEDTGIGIGVEHLEQIFEAFIQADAGITRRHGGTGLGLTISRHLVKLMGGTIWVESHPGKGSTFHITLPLKPTTPPVPPPAPTPGATPVEVERPLHILLVEDAEDNRVLIRTFLKNTPHHLHMAGDGEEAVQLVRDEPFDLVFMDVQMPVMDGYTATRAIRRWEREGGRAPLPIIALTAHALEGEAELSRQAGCDLHLTKPIKKQRLLEVIRRFGERLAVTA